MSGSSGASAGGLSRAAGPIAREDEQLERRGEAAAALWVALAERVHAPNPLPVGEVEPPNAWRPSAGDLTPHSGSVGASTGGESEAKAPERLTLRVDGGHLGELSVTLDREGDALRVVIGLQNERDIGEIVPDARALRSALESAGLSVHTLNIVQASQVGTVLAQRRSNPSAPKQPTDPQGSAQHGPETQKRDQKRLQLIG